MDGSPQHKQPATILTLKLPWWFYYYSHTDACDCSISFERRMYKQPTSCKYHTTLSMAGWHCDAFATYMTFKKIIASGFQIAGI